MAQNEIRSKEPVKNTIHNLIQTLSVKLDSAARYDLYADDARKDGFDDCAELFSSIASRDLESINGLVNCLKKHIGQE